MAVFLLVAMAISLGSPFGRSAPKAEPIGGKARARPYTLQLEQVMVFNSRSTVVRIPAALVLRMER